MDIKNNNKKFPAILFIVVISLVILFGFALWQEDSNQGIMTNIGLETTFQQPTIATNEDIITEPVKELTEEESDEALSRDEIRLDDINKMKQALENYKNDKGNYPEVIDQIVPDYLSALLKDPTPDQFEYNYTCIGSTPCRFYDLTYELEVGVGEITPGMHVSSPDEIASP